MRPLVYSLVFTCIFLLTGCREDPASASIRGNMYVNDYLGFSIQIPDGWSVMDIDRADGALQSQAKTIAWSHNVSEEELETSASEIYPLLNIYRITSDPSSINRSSITAGAVKMPPGPDRTACRDLLAGLRELMNSGKIPYRVSEDIAAIELGSKPFYRLDASLSGQDMAVFQTYLSGEIKGYALLLVYTDGTKEGLDSLVTASEGFISF